MLSRVLYIGIATLAGVAMLFSCQGDLQTIDDLTRLDEGPLKSAYEVEIVYTDHGHIRMILQTPQMDRYEGEEPYLEMPLGLHVQFYDTLKNKTSRMSANYAISHEGPEIFEASNDVVVVNELGERLNTEHLIWDQAKAVIYSEKFVKITTADDRVLYGEGFVADERFDTWEITRPRGSFPLETPRSDAPE